MRLERARARAREVDPIVVLASAACECACDDEDERAMARLGLGDWAIGRTFWSRWRRLGRRRRLERVVRVERTRAGALTRAVVLETAERTYVYAFGGTRNARDAATDANVTWARVREDVHARAHRGFLTRAEMVAVEATYEGKVLGRGNARLVMCGHSLGGATAALATVLFLLKRPEASRAVRCVTFGCPPIGDDGLRRLIAERGWTRVFTHVQMPEDNIPRLVFAARQGYAHFVPPTFLLKDGRLVTKSSLDEDDDSLERARRESAGLTHIRGAVYAHAMKTYRARLMLSVRASESSRDGDDVPVEVPVRAHLGPAPTLRRAVGVLTRDGARVMVLVQGAHVDARTCSITRAEAKGWPCAATSSVLAHDSLLVIVSAPVLHGAPLPSDAVCSRTNHASWMPLVVGAGGDFSISRVNVRVAPRTIVFVRGDDASLIIAERLASLMEKQTGWVVEEVEPIRGDGIDNFVASMRGRVVVHATPDGGCAIRRGGSTDPGERVQADDAKRLEKVVRATLGATELDALRVALVDGGTSVKPRSRL